jgi:mannosyltransferase
MRGAATVAPTTASVADPPPPDEAPPVRAAGPPWRDRLLRLVPSVVPGALMLVAGLVGANRPVLSWDEVTTADVARRSPAEIWHLVQNIDAVFGPYYFFMHGWTRLAGTSELDLRLPSIVAMAAAVAAAGQLGRRLFDPVVGTVTGILLCALPNTSRYAAEARPYAFACLMSVLALLALVGALERGRPLRWAGYGVSVVLLGLGHLVALATLAAHAAMVLIHARRERSWRVIAAWGATLAAALVVLSPVVLLGVRQRDSQLAWVDPLTVGALGSAPGQIVGSVPTAWLLVGLALVAHWRPVSAMVPVALLAAAPVTVVAAVSVLVSPMWVARYLLVVLVPLAMLAAVTVVGQLRVDRKPGGSAASRAPGPAALRLIVVLAVVAATAYPGQRAVRAPTAKNGPDYRSIAAIIQQHQRPGDGMVFEIRSRAMRAGLGYYLHRDGTFPRDLLQHRSAADAGRLVAEEYPDAAARVAGVPRVWLLVSGPRKDPATGYPALRPLLRDDYERVGTWQVNRGTVALYRLRG